MAIPTSRTRENGQVTIDTDKCTGCGKCVVVCNDNVLIQADGKPKVSETPFLGCIGCAHCMAICPQEAITIYGRTLSPSDMFDLPPIQNMANYEQLLTLFQKRRSIRKFTDKNVEPEIIEKILEAATTSPMGLPPSDVHVLIFDTKEKNRKFAEDFCEYLKNIKWLISNWFITLMRPFWGKTNDEMFRKFIRPLYYAYTEGMNKGINYVNYDAPLVIYFYGSPYTDPADPIIAATSAMYAAEALGLGTCMIGAIHPLIQYGGKAKKFRAKYNIKYPSREGIVLIFGYPAVKYRKGVKRTFGSVTYNMT
jgi:nitroreductase/NAD-dependent dihydropyrimidine dehydrogenase PreA subunit